MDLNNQTQNNQTASLINEELPSYLNGLTLDRNKMLQNDQSIQLNQIADYDIGQVSLNQINDQTLIFDLKPQQPVKQQNQQIKEEDLKQEQQSPFKEFYQKLSTITSKFMQSNKQYMKNCQSPIIPINFIQNFNNDQQDKKQQQNLAKKISDFKQSQKKQKLTNQHMKKSKQDTQLNMYALQQQKKKSQFQKQIEQKLRSLDEQIKNTNSQQIRQIMKNNQGQVGQNLGNKALLNPESKLVQQIHNKINERLKVRSQKIYEKLKPILQRAKKQEQRKMAQTFTRKLQEQIKQGSYYVERELKERELRMRMREEEMKRLNIEDQLENEIEYKREIEKYNKRILNDVRYKQQINNQSMISDMP